MTLPIVFKWATAETNYPAGGNPWNATPVNVAPVGDIFTPNTKPGAQNLNYILNKLGNTDANILAALGTAQFFPTYAPLPSSFQTYGAVAYDPLSCKWLMAGIAPTSGFASLADGRGVGATDWHLYTVSSDVVFPASVCRGIEPGLSPANKYVYVGAYDTGSGAAFLERWDTNANSVTQLALAETSAVQDVQVMALSGVQIIAVGATSAAHSILKYSTNSGATPTTVVNPAISVPGGWLLAQTSPGFGPIMVIPRNAGGGHDTSAHMDVWTSTDGTTWVHTTVSSLLGASESPTSLCYGQDSTGANCWTLTTDNAGTMHVYRSYNTGTSWAALTSNLPNINKALWGMAALGPLFVAQVKELGSARLLFSYDGATTWQVCNTAQANSGLGVLQIAAGTNSFMGMSSLNGLTASFAYGPAANLGT